MRSLTDKIALLNYTLEGHTIEEAAEHFNISKALAIKVLERAKSEKEKILAVANFIISGHSIEEAMQEFQTSGRTINRMLDEVRKEDGLFYNEILAEKISLVLTKVLLEARAEAGRKHKGKFMISDEEAEEMLNQIIYGGASLRSLAKDRDCSHTTIANAISRVAAEEVKKANVKFSKEDSLTISEKVHVGRILDILANLKDEMDPDVYQEIYNMYKKPRGR